MTIINQLASELQTESELITNIEIVENSHIVYFVWNNSTRYAANLSKNNQNVKKNSVTRM